MKPWFANQVTERPRSGSRWEDKTARQYGRAVAKSRHLATEDPEEGEEFLPRRKVSMNGPGSSKSFSDLLGPLRGYLLSSVGRPWDEVYSEISENIPANSMQGRHIRGHVKQFVATDAVLVDGIVLEQSRYGGIRPIYEDFYVHPTTGLLERTEGGRGRYKSTDGRWMYLETWVLHHVGKSVERVRGILLMGKSSSGEPPTDDQIYTAMNKVCYVDERGLLREKSPGAASEKAAQARRDKKAELARKEEAALNRLRDEAKKKKMEKRARKRRE